ncbi:hypothetical protein M569_08209, partial [Genlisea aurea]
SRKEMGDSSNGRSSFWTQANALLRKNLIFQRRNSGSNVRLIIIPVILCILLLLIQKLVNTELDKPSNRCGCACVDVDGSGHCVKQCGIQYSTVNQVFTCPIPHPPEWPALLQVPNPQYRAVRNDFLPYSDLPDDSCRSSGTCPATVLITGNNQTFAQSVVGNFFARRFGVNLSDPLYSLSFNALGTGTWTEVTNYLESAFYSGAPVDYIESQCTSNPEFNVTIPLGAISVSQVISCAPGLTLWRNSSSDVNNELYKGYRKGNPKREINEILAAYDLMTSNENLFNVTIWYNSTYKNNSATTPMGLTRVPRSVNLASNAYLELRLGDGTQMPLEFVKETPKPATVLRLDFSSLLGPLFFTWVIVQLFPIILINLVYEKQYRLRIMMKMHGLGDGPYWLISYGYFLAISVLYMFFFVLLGSVIGLKFFTLNSYSIQFVFYFLYVNLQISVAFLVANLFSNVKTVTVVGYLIVFGNGLLGGFLFEFFLQDFSFSKAGIIAMELYPGFGLFRGLYELSQYSFTGDYMGTSGMRWKNLNDSENGMKDVLIIFVLEWLVVLVVAFYTDQFLSSGKSPLSFLRRRRNANASSSSSSFRRPSLSKQSSKVFVQMDKADVAQEREKVEQLLLESPESRAILCNDIKKVYPGRDGNPEKYAVRGLSLALPQGECFGMLGPNGAGKTSFINMMIGLIKPSSGTAYVNGLDIQSDMDQIYTSMGVCPQHDLLWETLTGREHLLFYGRLKNLKGAALNHAVEESLKSVNLFYGGVADKQAGKYSGGMKRRLSVAISLIGDPKVVYMDEPSTGLDPASRNMLWNVVKQAKRNRAIVLTTHSMEEAEYLCDRLGIFVDGSLQCIGNPKELKARYGGSYVFTMTTSSDHEEYVESLVRGLSPNAVRVYQISGTQKFELPKQEIRIADVFGAVEDAKRRF